jgi:hypothetical protein
VFLFLSQVAQLKILSSIDAKIGDTEMHTLTKTEFAQYCTALLTFSTRFEGHTMWFYDEFVQRAKSSVPPGSHIWVVEMAFLQLNTSHMTDLKRHVNLQKKAFDLNLI